ncbi:hypothetical protein JD844_031323 [Phrynosoma platyrhinos]|uniref:Cell adhesion molecule-related/down-regulated by oncogenes n=1 Tax=Phrynosoma platyrhinos TaxID=52577 RepID=A0ABQ7T0S3_PHRPL|nr:hypothetical protein JD844_031323 [Phrynosoma platyrhinos]
MEKGSDLIPYFVSEPLSTVQKPGATVKLHCSAEPSTAHVSWLFNGEKLHKNVEQVDTQSGFLTVFSLSQSNSGIYQCIANNSNGAIISRPARVSIAYLDDFETSWRNTIAVEEGNTALISCKVPRSNPKAQVRFRVRGKWLEQSAGSSLADFDIIHPSTSQALTVLRNSPLMLECVVSGLSVPYVYWYKDGKDALARGRWKIFHTHLTIDSVDTSDAGSYSCVVDNKSGVVKHINYSVNVFESPSISKGLQDQLVSLGKNVHLSCEIHGNPVPNLTWYHNAAPVHLSSRHLLSGNKLRIIGITREDTGLYQCLVNNGIGFVHSTGRLHSQAVSYETSTKTDNTVPVEVAQSDEGDGDHDSEIDPESSSPTKIVIDEVATEKASNGISPPEAPIILSPPQTLKPDQYNLVWRPGRDGGQPINFYFVKYRKLDDNFNITNWYTVRVPGSENELCLSELEPSSLYEVLMVARNVAGEGQPSMLTFRTSKAPYENICGTLRDLEDIKERNGTQGSKNEEELTETIILTLLRFQTD